MAIDLSKPNRFDRFVDLGAGDGRVVRAFLPLVSEAIGYEIDESLPRDPHVKISDFFNEDLSRFSLVYCYLTAEAMRLLRSKLHKECRPGTRIISIEHAIPGWVSWKMYRQVHVAEKRDYFIYVYLTPISWELGCNC